MIFMFHIVLVNPEIPPNTGNIIRLAANLGAWLHLVAPLGFELEDRLLRRAGLNYHDKAGLQVHDSLAEALANKPLERSFAVTGGGETCFNAPAYNAGDVFVFGRESTGLSDAHRALFPPQRRLYIPMRPDNPEHKPLQRSRHCCHGSMARQQGLQARDDNRQAAILDSLIQEPISRCRRFFIILLYAVI